MATATRKTELPPIIGRKLRQLRRQIRAYVWIDGISALVIVLGGAFWLGLTIDRWIEPPPWVRSVVLASLAVAIAWIVFDRLLRRGKAPLADSSLAVLLERKFHRLDDHLLTAVDLATSSDPDTYHPELVSRTNRSAAEAIAGVRTSDLLRTGPLLQAAVLAGALLASIPVFALVANDTFQFWLQRVALSAELWPRRVQLEVVGFPADKHGQRTHKMAQGDRFELLVRADGAEHVVPREVELRFRMADGRRGRDTMIRVGDLEPESGAATSRPEQGKQVQLFRYEFKQVASDMTLDVVGGDDRIRDLNLKIVDRPELAGMEIECHYPDYLGRPDRRLPLTGGMRIPEGTQLSVHATATKPLEKVDVHSSRGTETLSLDAAQRLGRNIDWDYGVLSADDVLTIRIADTDGIAGREPYRISLSVIPDELPQLAVRLVGIGTAITADAVLPLAGSITDDYGLEQAWFDYRVDDAQSNEIPFQQHPTGQTSITELDRFDTRPLSANPGERALELAPGQTLYLTVRASDSCDLHDAPRVGSSQQFALDVVTESQLLAMLERRELELRQRFEAIYVKMTDTRNLLGRIDFQDDAAKATAEGEPAANDESSAAAKERAAARRRLRVAGSLQNVTQSAHEILGVAEAFDDVHHQLENNRIDNVDLKSRLREQIALPLRQLGEVRMTELESQLQLVEENLADGEAGMAASADAGRLADEILLEMQQVLDRMLELESYNEVVALLRGIIQDQRSLNDKTKQQRAERLQSLLDD
jgi:hypothetical protein